MSAGLRFGMPRPAEVRGGVLTPFNTGPTTGHTAPKRLPTTGIPPRIAQPVPARGAPAARLPPLVSPPRPPVTPPKPLRPPVSPPSPPKAPCLRVNAGNRGSWRREIQGGVSCEHVVFGDQRRAYWSSENLRGVGSQEELAPNHLDVPLKLAETRKERKTVREKWKAL